MYIRKAMRTNKRPNQVIQIENEKEREREKKESIIIFLQFSCWYLYKMTPQNGQHGQGYGSFYISSRETKNTIFKRHIIHNASTKSRNIKRSERKYYAFF